MVIGSSMGTLMKWYAPLKSRDATSIPLRLIYLPNLWQIVTFLICIPYEVCIPGGRIFSLVDMLGKKLDRVAADVDWQLAFPHALVEVLPLHDSYHNPLLLTCEKHKSTRVNLFHFQAAWMAHPEYEPLVNNT